VRLWARLALGTASLAAVGWVATGCSSLSRSSLSRSSASRSSSQAWSIVAVGDSVPRGTNCQCTPFPQLTADDLARSTHRNVRATNDAFNGATTATVLSELNSDSAMISHVRMATAIEIEVGANDVGQTAACGTAVACYAPQLPSLEKNLSAIIARIRELTSGHRVVLVLLDYWNVWLGGRYETAEGAAYVSAADQLTDRVDLIIKTIAREAGAYYVDLRAAFKGPEYSEDETQYLSNDGDHPNAAGHAQIAKAVEPVLERALG
jgi:acyl-CoA thioesterase-1